MIRYNRYPYRCCKWARTGDHTVSMDGKCNTFEEKKTQTNDKA